MRQRGVGRRSSWNRPGFTIVELVVVVLFLGILAAIALPSYQKIVYRARAAKIVGDLNAIRTAAHQYYGKHGQWPPDTGRGLPPALDDYVAGVDFEGAGYLLDWDNWDPVIGISVLVADRKLESALLTTLETQEGTFMRLSDRYTYFVESTHAP